MWTHCAPKEEKVKTILLAMLLTGCCTFKPNTEYMDGVQDGFYTGCIHILYSLSSDMDGLFSWKQVRKNIDFEDRSDYCQKTSELYK